MTLALPDELIEAVRVARHLAVLTGAGTPAPTAQQVRVSAESGVPTFRHTSRSPPI